MPTRKQIKAFEQTLLFHGTVEPFDTALEPQSHGGCLWVAFASTIAQNYIPVSGGRLCLSVDIHSMHITPSKNFFALYRALGWPEPDIKYDVRGRLESFRWPDDYFRTGKDLVRDLKSILGYEPDEKTSRDWVYWIKDGYANHQEVILPADYKIPGRLFIFYGQENLSILDISRGESDLTDLQYHRYDVFKKAKDEGYDGVRIDDFAQSKIHGNYGHQSICLNSNGLAKLTYDVILATNYDEEEWADFTPEFEQYARKVMW